jgi:hypothetical protein
MPIDFFNSCCRTSSNNRQFGLCDDPTPANRPAYIDESNNDKWIAEVENITVKTVEFYAIDNCVEILRDDQTQESRCDGMLHCENSIIFVELKDRNYGGWVAKGREQITTTFNVFKSNYDISRFQKIEAYVCNKQKPRAITSCMIEKQKFKDDTGLCLNVHRQIVV